MRNVLIFKGIFVIINQCMENTNLKVNRILASLTDGLFMFLITIMICIAPAIVFFKGALKNDFVMGDLLWLIFSFIASVLIWILYLSIPSIFLGSTVGMRINGLTFASAKYKEIRFSHVLFRETTIVICLVLSLGLCLFSDLFSVLGSKDGKTYYDISSSLKVVSRYAF